MNNNQLSTHKPTSIEELRTLNSKRFIRLAYRSILGREPEPAVLENYIGNEKPSVILERLKNLDEPKHLYNVENSEQKKNYASQTYTQQNSEAQNIFNLNLIREKLNIIQEDDIKIESEVLPQNKEIISKLLNLVIDNCGKNSPLPLATWSSPALKQFAKILVGDKDILESKDGISIPEVVHILYFQYLRRIADDGALAKYSSFKSVQDVFTTCTNSLLGSAEFQKHGRLPKFVKTDSTPRPTCQVLIDVTNSYKTGARTGIQRVVRELCSRLPQELKANLIYLGEKGFYHIDYKDGDFVSYQENKSTHEVTFHPGDIYFDMDASWGDAIGKWEQYSILKNNRVRIVHLHYDAVPVLFPDYSHPTTVLRYIEHFIASITFSDLFLCISHAVKDDLEKIICTIGGKLPKMTVIPMGGNYAVPNLINNPIEHDAIKFSKKRRFILCVGTVEPRKNYSMLLNVLPLLASLNISLLIVGKRGWEKEDVLQELDTATQSNPYFGWFSNIDDITLETLYNSCFAYLTTSFYEGYGLPVMEALLRKCVVISSDAGALPEAGNGLSLLFSPNEPKQLLNIIKELATNESYYQKRKALTRDYTALSWDQSSTSITQCIQPYLSRIDNNIQNSLLQLVYISISPDNLRISLQSFVQHVNTKRVLILTKSSLRQEMLKIIKDFYLDGVVLCDEDVLDSNALAEADHQARNFILRRALYSRNEIDENFIAVDDDCVVLKSLPDSFFVKNGKFIGRKSFHSMSKWSNSPFGCTSYDQGQWQTSNLLKQYGYNDAAYSAHHAQLLNKSIVMEIYKEFSATNTKNIDEWSVYFNVAEHRYSNKFTTSTTTALYWPNNYSSWQPTWFNYDVYFENYYSSNYTEGGAAFLAGITPEDDWKIKLLHCKSQYERYKFQNMLGTLLSFGQCALIQNINPDGQCEITINNNTIFALPDLWVRIPFEGAKPTVLGYTIWLDEELLVDGTRHRQQVSHSSGLMVKIPNKSGEFKLKIFTMPLLESHGVVDASIFVFQI